jgi:hypothetical protein
MQLLYKCIWIVGLFAVLSTGCKKFVQIGPPPTQLVTSSVFDNSATATSALTGIYAQMANAGESYYIALNNGLLADEFMNYSTQQSNIQLYTDEMTAVVSPDSRWSPIYNYIYQANAVIEGMSNSGLNPAIQQQLTGEALFLRAFWLFYLTNMYGAIPLTTTTSYTTNATLSRSPQTAVYQQIIADLSQAQTMLNSNYVDGSDTTITTQRTRPTRWAASALLARVYLYTQKYDSAEIEATAVINNASLYSLCPNLSGPNSPFLANSTEAIWQLQIPLPNPNVATPDGLYFILTSAPSTGQTNSTTMSSALLGAFEPGDNRLSNWIGNFSSGGDTFYFPYKYKVYNSSGASAPEYVMVLRFAEQFLIRAEAEANLGDSTDAITDLEAIRYRAGLTIPYNPMINGPLLTAILHERQVELFTEWGHRWFDLIRTGNANSVLGSPGNVCQQKGGIWNSNSELYPIPQTERTADPNLSQNMGY